MQKRIVLLATMALAALAAPPPASSFADYCYYPFSATEAVVPPVDPVPGPWPNGFGPGECPSGESFLSSAPPCPPPPFVGAWFGQYCGPAVPPGVQIVCSGVAGPGVAMKGLVAGFDTTLDGNINMADAYGSTPGLAVDTVPDAAGVFSVDPYPHGAPAARVIVYPLAESEGGSLVLVSCSTGLPVP